MIAELIKALLCGFVAGLGFGGLLHAPRRALGVSSLIGALGYVCYFALLHLGLSEAVAMFTGAFLSSVAAQIAARRMRMIATIFVTVAIIPLVPGLGLYRAMSAFGSGGVELGAAIVAQTMTLILMIALGVGFGSSIVAACTRRDKPQAPARKD